MNRSTYNITAIVLLWTVCTAVAQTPEPSAEPEPEYSRARYELIVERAPFATDPVEEEPVTTPKESALAKAAAQRLEKELRLCFLLENNAGEVRAGFQNLKSKPGDPRSVVLRVGESFRGMKLMEIDLKSSSASLQHMGQLVDFQLSKSRAAPVQAPAPAPQTRTVQNSGFRGRTQRQATEEPQLTPQEQAAKREEVRKNLRQYQMEVIRAGMPPLPIPLTQEMDDQLVSEGVLPPE